MPDIGSPILRQQYPALRESESRVLRAHLRANDPETVRRLRTQKRVGEGETVPSLDEKWREVARDLSRWKIDAVIDYPGFTEIVELKSRATHTAMGQVEAYAAALARETEERSDFRLTVAAYRVHPDFELGAADSDVRLSLYPQADPTTASR
jgi:hypothetical protein